MPFSKCFILSTLSCHMSSSKVSQPGRGEHKFITGSVWYKPWEWSLAIESPARNVTELCHGKSRI